MQARHAGSQAITRTLDQACLNGVLAAWPCSHGEIGLHPGIMARELERPYAGRCCACRAQNPTAFAADMRRMAQLLVSRASAVSAAVRPAAAAGRPAAAAQLAAQRMSVRTLAPFPAQPAGPQVSGMFQLRAVASDASPAIADVLREEVTYEKENYQQPEARLWRARALLESTCIDAPGARQRAAPWQATTCCTK